MTRLSLFFSLVVILSSQVGATEIHTPTQDFDLWRMSTYLIDGERYTSTTFRLAYSLERTVVLGPEGSGEMLKWRLGERFGNRSLQEGEAITFRNRLTLYSGYSEASDPEKEETIDTLLLLEVGRDRRRESIYEKDRRVRELFRRWNELKQDQ